MKHLVSREPIQSITDSKSRKVDLFMILKIQKDEVDKHLQDFKVTSKSRYKKELKKYSMYQTAHRGKIVKEKIEFNQAERAAKYLEHKAEAAKANKTLTIPIGLQGNSRSSTGLTIQYGDSVITLNVNSEERAKEVLNKRFNPNFEKYPDIKGNIISAYYQGNELIYNGLKTY